MQAWLLSQGRCVGCGTPLTEGKKKGTKYGEQVTCIKCGEFLFMTSKLINIEERFLKKLINLLFL